MGSIWLLMLRYYVNNNVTLVCFVKGEGGASDRGGGFCPTPDRDTDRQTDLKI